MCASPCAVVLQQPVSSSSKSSLPLNYSIPLFTSPSPRYSHYSHRTKLHSIQLALTTSHCSLLCAASAIGPSVRLSVRASQRSSERVSGPLSVLFVGRLLAGWLGLAPYQLRSRGTTLRCVRPQIAPLPLDEISMSVKMTLASSCGDRAQAPSPSAGASRPNQPAASAISNVTLPPPRSPTRSACSHQCVCVCSLSAGAECRECGR